MKNQKTYFVKLQNGEFTEPITYAEVCHRLNINPDVQFVKINAKSGTISFTCGKPQEISYLLSAVKSAGYVPAKRLLDAARH
jgi:spore coat protein U-like protein